jgi:hypothetical protein
MSVEERMAATAALRKRKRQEKKRAVEGSLPLLESCLAVLFPGLAGSGPAAADGVAGMEAGVRDLLLMTLMSGAGVGVDRGEGLTGGGGAGEGGQAEAEAAAALMVHQLMARAEDGEGEGDPLSSLPPSHPQVGPAVPCVAKSCEAGSSIGLVPVHELWLLISLAHLPPSSPAAVSPGPSPSSWI